VGYGLSHYEKWFSDQILTTREVFKAIRGGEGIPTWALIRNDPNGWESSRRERRECLLISDGGPE
jgi:hypothetical protein